MRNLYRPFVPMLMSIARRFIELAADSGAAYHWSLQPTRQETDTSSSPRCLVRSWNDAG